MAPFAFWRWKRNNAQKAIGVAAGSDFEGYQAQPWNSQAASANQSDINLGQMNTGYPPTHGPPMYGQAPAEGRQFV